MLPDGNCLFRSLSKALFAVPSGHLTLRKLIVGFIESNPRQLGGLCNGSVNDYCQDMRISGHFGMQAELQAGASLFQIPIYIFQKPSGTRGWEWMVYRPQPKDTLNLRSICSRIPGILPPSNFRIEILYNATHFDVIANLTPAVQFPLTELPGMNCTAHIDLST